MTERTLNAHYRDYIRCLNRQQWTELDRFVSASITYNGVQKSIEDYKLLLIDNFLKIPNLQFDIGTLIVDGERLAARLLFECNPTDDFLGLPVGGRRVSFAENVFYRFGDGRIEEVWSVIDKMAIEAQLLDV